MGITAYLPNRDPEFIASWKGFQQFSDALHQLGATQFPMILKQLPDGDEGKTTAEKAKTMLDELRHFIAQQTAILQAVLVDTERDSDISMGSNALGGILTRGRESGFDLGFDEKGFFIQDGWEMNRELFRAMRVEQKLIDAEEQQVEYINLDTKQTFACRVVFGKIAQDDAGHPTLLLQRFHIELRPSTSNRFAYITSPLQAVLEASIESGEEIRWV